MFSISVTYFDVIHVYLNEVFKCNVQNKTGGLI